MSTGITRTVSLERTLLAIGMVEVSIASSDEVICLAMGSEGGRELTAWARLSLHSFKMERALSVALDGGGRLNSRNGYEK